MEHRFKNVGLFGIVLIAGLFFLMSFSEIESTDQDPKNNKKEISLIDKKLEEKIQNFRKIILDKCKKEAIEKAELFVDSIVAEEYRILSNDTISFPSKPIRPSLPKKIILNDSTSIDPILSGD